MINLFSTPNTYKKTSFGPLLTDIFLFLLLKGTKNSVWSALKRNSSYKIVFTIKLNALMANGPLLAHIFGKKFKINETTLCI